MAVGTDSPRAALGLVERHVALAVAAVLAGLAGGAWYLTVRQADRMSGMASGLGQVGVRMPADTAIPLFLAMWLTMMVAMMFPTVVPMVLAHRMVVRNRGEGTAATVAFVGGYLAVWTAIGVAPLGMFLAFGHAGADAAHDRWISLTAGGILAAAGLYQFTRWKGRCLRACRTPLGFILEHNFGGGAHAAARAGISHGAWCFGCCWALMAVLLVVGLMNLAWMVLLSLIFLLEKNWRRGVGLTRLAGSLLLALGVAVAVYPHLLLIISGVSTARTGSGGGM